MKLRKVLSAILCIAMVLGTMSFTALAGSDEPIDPYAGYTIVEVTTEEELGEAVDSVTAGEPTVITFSGEMKTYAFPLRQNSLSGKNIVFKANKDITFDTSAFNVNGTQCLVGSFLTFDGVNVKFPDNSWYMNGYTGLNIATGTLTYKNCTIYGSQHLYTYTVAFENCTFVNMTNEYCVRVYGATDVKFKGCTFNTGGKAVLCYHEGEVISDVVFDNCIFNSDSSAANDKAAVEVAKSGSPNTQYTLTFINDCVANGFVENPEGTPTGSNLWANKNSMDFEHLAVNIDGKVVNDPLARSLTVDVEEEEAYVDDEIVAKVVVNGNNMTGANWEFEYNPNEFYCAADEEQDGKIDGIIKGNKFSGTTSFTDGQEIAAYTLKVLAQTDNNHVATLGFTSNSMVGSDNEVSAATPARETVLNPDTVKIAFKTFDTVKFWVDGVEKTASPEKINYDGKAHTFAVTVPEENVTISYDINNIINIGTYEITYTIKKDGYADKVGTFTIEIIEPTKEIEIVPDFVTGKVAVLVYTNIDDISYEYDGKLMVDVTAKSYKYDGSSYTRVFGYVTEPLKISGIITLDKTEYAKKLAASVPADAANLKIITNVDCDLNDVGGVEFYDVIAGYGVYNARTEFFTDLDLMKTVFKADVNCDKAVKSFDAEAVYNALYKSAE